MSFNYDLLLYIRYNQRQTRIAFGRARGPRYNPAVELVLLLLLYAWSLGGTGT